MARDYIKMQELEELRQAIKAKEINEELLESLGSSLAWLIRYSQKNGIPLPEESKIISLIEKARNLLAQVYPDTSPEVKHSHFSPDNETEPDCCVYFKGPHLDFYTGAVKSRRT